MLERFGSVTASPSPSVPSSMPPPASIPSASSAASPSPTLSTSAALPPGTPSSSKLSVAPASSEAPRAGGKRAREEGGSVKGGVKSRRISSVVQFREGKDYAVSLEEGGIRMAQGSIVRGTVQDNFRVHSREFDEFAGEFDRDSGVQDRDLVGEDNDREDGEIRDDDDLGDGFGPGVDTPAFSVDQSSLSTEWGDWKTLKPPFSLALHNGAPKALYNSSNGSQTPIEHIKLATMDDGTRMFAVRSRKPEFKVKAAPEIFGTRHDKLKASQYFATFQSSFPKVPSSVAEKWLNSWDAAVQVPSKVLSKADLPFTVESATKTFENLAAGISCPRPSLAPTIVAFIKEFEPIISCLPVRRFFPSELATEFGVHLDSLVSLKKELLNNEYHRRLNLLSAICHFSSQLSMVVLSEELEVPSAFEGGVKNCVGGYSGTLLYSCNAAMRDFLEARVALRKSAFKNPLDHYSQRMIRSSPFSKTLFDQVERLKIDEEFSKVSHKTITWESLLNKKSPSSNQQQQAAPKPSAQSWKGKQPARGRGRGSPGSSYRGKGGPFKSSGGGNNNFRGQGFRQNNQRSSRGRGGRGN